MRVTINGQYLSDIANSIRAKLSTRDTYKPSEMAAAIYSIHTETVIPTYGSILLSYLGSIGSECGAPEVIEDDVSE